jgi:aminopeptidase N
MGKDTPYYPVMLKSIVDNMNVANREELLDLIDKASQPTPEQQESAAKVQEAELAFQASQTAALSSQAEESNARALKLAAEAQAVPQEVEIARMKAITTNLQAGDGDDKEFERRMRVSEGMLKEREVVLKERKDQREAQPNVAENALMERLSPPTTEVPQEELPSD